MLKKVHTLTSLPLHRNMTKLTSMDMQIQIFEYVGHRVPKSAVKCRLLRRNSGMVPLRGQESRWKFQTTRFHWPSNFNPCPTGFTPHSDGRKRNLAVSEIFRIFSIAFAETFKTGCNNSLKNKHPHG